MNKTKCKFQDLLLDKKGIIRGPFGGDVKKEYFVSKGENTFKVYEQGVVYNRDSNYGSYYITEDKFNSLSRFEVRPGDILISGAGTLGELYELPQDIERGIINQALIRIRINENVVDKEYFKHYFSWYVKLVACKHVGASVIPNLPPLDDLKKIDIELPDIETQKNIASVLTTIDRKIALNKSINCDLEAMARQLYDYWFVQFDFPNAEGKPYKSSGGKMVWNETLKREIPEGWIVDHLNKWIDIKSGFAFKSSDYKEKAKYKVITIKNVQENKLDTSNCDMIDFIPSKMKDWCKLSKGNRLISLTGNCGRLCIVSEDNLLLNQRVGLLDCSKEYLEFEYGSLQSEELQSKIQYLSNGAAQENLSPIDLCNLYWFMPVKDIISKFETILRNIRLLQISKEVETKKLVQQRDTLLPLLMNGQVSIKQLTNRNLSFSIIFATLPSKTMKVQFIANILANLASTLNDSQLSILKSTLESELSNYQLTPSLSPSQQTQKENADLKSAFLSAKRIEGCSDRTLKYYESIITQFIDNQPSKVQNITTNDIRTYLSDNEQKSGASHVTIDNMRRILSSFFSWLEDEDYIVKSPVRKIHKIRSEQKVKETFTDEELECMRDNCHSARDLAIIDMLASTGMRIGELVLLNRSDINYHERQCIVLGKGNKQREVYFNARAKLHLQAYINSRTDSEDALFVSYKHNTRLTINAIERMIRYLGRSLSITKSHPHKFRRTLATMAIDKGMPIEQVQRLLGHSKIDTTLHYAMVNQQNVKVAHRKFIQ